MKKDKKRLKDDERGMAMIETLPLLVIFVVLISYGLGLWGTVHTAILHSIAARTFSFEAFRNRTNVTYYRDDSTNILSYELEQVRFHAVNTDQGPNDRFYATQRPIAIGREVERSEASSVDHNQRIYEIPQRNREGGVEVSPAWIMVGYGMCLVANCGGQ